jgi:hypothetical protein
VARRIERTIASELRRLGVSDPLVTFRVVNQLERQHTGKMQRFVPLAAATVMRPDDARTPLERS